MVRPTVHSSTFTLIRAGYTIIDQNQLKIMLAFSSQSSTFVQKVLAQRFAGFDLLLSTSRGAREYKWVDDIYDRLTYDPFPPSLYK